MNIGFQKTMAVGPRGKDGKQGEPGKDGTGTGTVNSVNDIEPDATGNVVLPVPSEPDLSGLATKVALKAYEDRRDNPNKVTTEQVNMIPQQLMGSTLPINFPYGVTVWNVAPENGFPDWGSITNIKASSTGAGSIQLFSHYTAVNGFMKIRTSLGNYAEWSPFVDIVTSKLPPRINAVLAAGWTSFAPGEYQQLAYYKDAFGIVHVSGMVSKGTTAGHLVTTLPVGYRPLRTNNFYVNLVEGFIREAIMKPDGTLMISGPTNAVHAVNFSFRTD